MLEGFLDEKGYLGPFHLGFRPGYGRETALVDGLCRELNSWSAFLLLIPLVAFDITDQTRPYPSGPSL